MYRLALLVVVGCSAPPGRFIEHLGVRATHSDVAVSDVSYDGDVLRGVVHNRSETDVEAVWLSVRCACNPGAPDLWGHRALPNATYSMLNPGEGFRFSLDYPRHEWDASKPLDVFIEAQPIAAQPPQLRIIPRAEWDPRLPPQTGMLRYREKSRSWIVVHHTSFQQPEGPGLIEEYHLWVSGFSDIGYHYVIDTHGKVYEGRSMAFMGAHAGQSRDANVGVVRARRSGDWDGVYAARKKDPDYGAIGVVLDGHFGAQQPTRAQQVALRWLVERLRTEHNIGWNEVVTHREVKERIVEARGHTFAGHETTCPGNELQNLVEGLRGADAS